MMKFDEGTPTCQSGALKIIINKLPCWFCEELSIRIKILKYEKK